MSEDAQSDAPEAVETLDQVIDSFNVQAPETTNVQELKPAQPAARVDMYDENSVNQWTSDIQNSLAELKSENQSLKADADTRNAADAEKIIDANIKSAVDVITKGIEGLDPLSAEILLEKTARENPKFKDLFHNQKGNEDMYQNALKAIVNENEGKFQRIDTQLAENHRAAQQSTQSNNTQKATEYGTPLEEALANAKTDGERQVIWTKAKNLGY